MTQGPTTLVITGGTSGIGAATVLKAASRGYQIAFTGTRSREKVDSKLLALPATIYVKADAGDRWAALELHKTVRDKFGADLGKLLVVANAGIEATDNEKERVDQMECANRYGPAYLLEAFAEDIRRSPAGLFVGVSSIVASLNVILPGNAKYHATKVAVANMVRGMAETYRDVNGIILSPGAIRTNMAEKSPLYGILLRFAAIAAVSDEGLRSQLGPFTQGEERLGKTSAEIFVNLLGNSLSNNPASSTLTKVLGKDPSMKGQTAYMLAAKTATHGETKARMAAILEALGVLIDPEVVASALLDEFESRRIPNGGELQVFQSGNEPIAPIARLFSP